MNYSLFVLTFLFMCDGFLAAIKYNNSDKTVTANIAEDKIVNPHSFNYTINPSEHVCGKNKGNQLFLLVYVHSAPKYFKRRLAIRETWANLYKPMRILFFMGETSDENVTKLLKYEYNMYGDLVQENFHDSYRNLTYKGIMALKWITEYCSNVKFVLKIDDDIIVNIFTLWRHLKMLDKYKMIPEKTIMCNEWNKMKVIRDKKSKWYLSPEEHKADYFGKYCSGSAFILTPNLINMYNISFYVKFFWVDDYYISGLLARASNATYFRFNDAYAIQAKTVEEKFKNRGSRISIFGHVSRRINTFYDIWAFIFSEQLNLLPHLPKDLKTELKNPINDFKWSFDVFY